MRTLTRLAMGAGAALALSVAAPVAAGAEGFPPPPPPPPPGASHVVFVQTDGTAGNDIVAYDRADDGTLTFDHAYSTGGSGGILNGSMVDHLASQGSLTYSPVDDSLYAVNAGSNTVSVFGVQGAHLFLRQVVSSGGVFPVSVTAHGNLVFVLNAEGGGSVQGYVSVFGRLIPIPWAHRSLGLTIPTDPTQFTHTPGQVAFSPDGSQILVTTKANGNDIDVYRVGPFGTLSASPVINAEGATVPFAVTFDSSGRLVVADAGTNALSTFTLEPDGVVNLIDSQGTGQSATCWVIGDHGVFYASNAGSGSESTFSESAAGALGLLGATSTDPGTVDASTSAGGQFLYVQTGGNGIVDGFRVGTGGSLSAIGSVTVPGAVGGEGIVAV